MVCHKHTIFRSSRSTVQRRPPQTGKGIDRSKERDDLREGGTPQARPRVSRIGLLPSTLWSFVCCDSVLPLAPRMRLLASPVQAAHDPLGGFDALLLRCVRSYAACCAFRMLCGTRASNECD